MHQVGALGLGILISGVGREPSSLPIHATNTSGHGYICSLLSNGGFRVGEIYRDLVWNFFDDKFFNVLKAYEAANYRMMSDAGALICRFSKHAETELEGGRIIEAIGKQAGGSTGEALIKHGLDEQRHHRMFAAMAVSVANDFDFEEIKIVQRDPSAVINNFNVVNGWKYLVCTIHWAEVRNIFILDQYLRSLDLSSWKCAKMLRRQIVAVREDELRHVGYTAELLEKLITENEEMREVTLSYRSVYEANCWSEIGEMSDFFANHEPVYA